MISFPTQRSQGLLQKHSGSCFIFLPGRFYVARRSAAGCRTRSSSNVSSRSVRSPMQSSRRSAGAPRTARSSTTTWSASETSTGASYASPQSIKPMPSASPASSATSPAGRRRSLPACGRARGFQASRPPVGLPDRRHPPRTASLVQHAWLADAAMVGRASNASRLSRARRARRHAGIFFDWAVQNHPQLAASPAAARLVAVRRVPLGHATGSRHRKPMCIRMSRAEDRKGEATFLRNTWAFRRCVAAES